MKKLFMKIRVVRHVPKVHFIKMLNWTVAKLRPLVLQGHCEETAVGSWVVLQRHCEETTVGSWVVPIRPSEPQCSNSSCLIHHQFQGLEFCSESSQKYLRNVRPWISSVGYSQPRCPFPPRCRSM